MVLPDSHRVSRAPCYSGNGKEAPSFRIQGYHPLWPNFPDRSPMKTFCNSSGAPQSPPTAPTTPVAQRLRAYTQPVWALPSSLAATLGISIDFFSYRYLDVSIPCVHLIILCIQIMIPGHDPRWVSPFGNPRIKACLAAPRGLSQPSTSFIVSQRQGIHHMSLVA